MMIYNVKQKIPGTVQKSIKLRELRETGNVETVAVAHNIFVE
jgi:hypothetical protein